MFETTGPVLFFDHFRVPYRVGAPAADDGFARARRTGTDHPQLLWPAEAARRWPEACAMARHLAGSLPVYARVVPDTILRPRLEGRGWSPDTSVTDAAGDHVASIWRGENGDVVLPFDPGEAIANLWSEAYATAGSSHLHDGIRRLSMTSYYRLRPLMPRRLQIGMRRTFARIQARRAFPRWPVEPALEDLYRLLFRLLADVAGRPVPWLAPWPDGHSWAFVLTHDVDTASGYDHRHLLREVERARGYRSSWNFVPRRYDVDDSAVSELKRAGCEVGVHGLHHDGRDMESLRTLRQRLPEIQSYVRRWGAAGFRSPATHRVHDWMPLFGTEYDSSYPDTDPFEPQSGGCCSLLPYFNGDLVELPITMPQDHTLFEILRSPNEQLWLSKARHVRAADGMALVITHPDYMIDPARLEAYDRYLAAFEDDETAWKALPIEVNRWWRRRAASTLVEDGSDWRIEGPAADSGRIVYAEPGAVAV